MKKDKHPMLVIIYNHDHHTEISIIVEKEGYNMSELLSSVQAAGAHKSNQNFDTMLIDWDVISKTSNLAFMQKIRLLTSTVCNNSTPALASIEIASLRDVLLSDKVEIVYKPLMK